MDFGEAFERGGVAALRLDEGDEFLPRGAVVEPAGKLRARDVGDFFREVEGEGAEVGRAAAAQALDGFGDFERVARGAAQRLVHRGEQVAHGDAHFVAHGFERGGEFDGFGAGFHEGTGTEFHIEHEAVERLRELFAHDAGDDERLRGHGRGDIAEGVKFFVRRTKVGGLADHGDAEAGELREGLIFAQRDVEAGDAFQFVERAAGDAEAAAGDHGHPQIIAREERREDERDFVADAAGAVFIDLGRRAGGIREHASAVHHRAGERAGFGGGHAAEEDGHGEGAGLVVGDFAGGVAADEGGNFGGVEFRAVAFALDESGDVHGGE